MEPHALRALFAERRSTILSVVATACKGVLLRTGAGRVKHLSTNQFWIRLAIKSSGIEVQNVPCANNASDVLADTVAESDLREGLQRMRYHTPKGCLEQPCA